MVLIVEDYQDLRESLTELLSEADYDVVSAPHGKLALEWLLDAAVRPDVILLDLMMPIMNGWQFLDARQTIVPIAAIPVVVMTAFEKESAGTLPPDTLLVNKPIAFEHLMQALRKACVVPLL